MSIGENIRRLRESHGMSQVQFAEIARVSDKAVSTWENNLKTPRMGAIQRLADHFGITKSDIIEEPRQNAYAFPLPDHPSILPIETRAVPILGEVACGEPIFAQEDFSSYTVVGSRVDCDFALRCKGDSMIGARIFDGDIVFVKRQEYVDDGSIAVVLLDDEATLKRVYHTADGRIELRAENPMYRPIIIGGPNETRTLRILGKAVAFQSIVV